MPVYSNTTAKPHASDVAALKRQMAAHLTSPVEFVSEVEAMYADGARVFVELGPKSVLTRLAGRILEGKPHTAIAVDDGSGLPGLLAGLAQLLCAGIDLNLSRLYERRDCRLGDPAEPAALRPPLPVPKHAWMLNGSGARRAAEPVKQIGVTLEQVQVAGTSADAATAGSRAIATTRRALRPKPVHLGKRIDCACAVSHQGGGCDAYDASSDGADRNRKGLTDLLNPGGVERWTNDEVRPVAATLPCSRSIFR